MKIEAVYSHLNGEEYLIVHRPEIRNEVFQVIGEVNAADHRDKVSEEKTMLGKTIFSPIGFNQNFRDCFQQRGWGEVRNKFWVTDDERLLRQIQNLDADEQKRVIEQSGKTPIFSYNQTDFVKDRVAVEVQFGKYAFVAHDLFVKHLALYVADVIDVGIEILPMKELEREMSSGVPYYERDLLNIIRQGRGVPAVPLILIGVLP